MTKWKLPTALFAAAVAVLGVAVAGGIAATAQAQTAAQATSSGGHPAAAAAAPGGSWSTATPVPGLWAVNDLTCTSRGNCVAVGPGSLSTWSTVTDSDASDVSDVATERNGVWHAAQRFALGGKTAGVILAADAVACSSAGNCVAGGTVGHGQGNNTPIAWVSVERNGAWGSAQLLSGITTVTAISCLPNGGCTAVGRDAKDPSQSPGLPGSAGMAVTETDGTWAKPVVIPESAAVRWWYFSLDSVSCTAKGDCSAGGSIYNGGSGGYQETVAILATETNGVWGAATLIPGVPTSSLNHSGIEQLSCQAPGDCTAGGWYSTTTLPSWTDAGGSFVSTETGGTWQPAVVVPVSDGGYAVTSLSCSSIGNCVVAGYDLGNGHPVTVDVVNGSVVGSPTALPGTAGLHVLGCKPGVMSCESSALVSCAPAGYCGIFGQYVVSGQPGGTVFAAVKTAAGWQPIQAIRGIRPESSISAITCTATGYCTAVGSYSTAQGAKSQAFAVDEATASATLLKVSAPTITYGHERTERLTINVTSHYADAVTGTVTIKAGSTILAVLTLKSGKASYALTAKRLKAGSYALTATYSGNAAYLGSAAPAVKVKVVK
jgi:hypothetical protein